MAVDKDNIPVVVVAEDDKLLRLHAADILADAGYEVINVPDADAALQAIAKRPEVRVLFTDIQMPGKLNGIELARKVHELWPRVLLLVTSGRPTACAVGNSGPWAFHR